MTDFLNYPEPHPIWPCFMTANPGGKQTKLPYTPHSIKSSFEVTRTLRLSSLYSKSTPIQVFGGKNAPFQRPNGAPNLISSTS